YIWNKICNIYLCLQNDLWLIRCTSFHFPDCSCPTGWSQYGKRCFLFQNTQKDWASAERTCNDFGANLASIHDNNEHDFLKKLVKTETGSFQRTWVGGHDAEKEGVWLWSDGSKFDYNKWSSGQPDNTGSNEHCLAINYEDPTYLWNDAPCTFKYVSICAKNA
uniref:Galactose-specific lectin nattectin-like n=1 Tax=Poecilia reticulata TaxID=8081 RepID=A0A3P9N544_POERE